MADSISSECSFLGHDYDFPLWSYIDELPEKRLRVDLLRGSILTVEVKSDRVREFFADFAKEVPKILTQHLCIPGQVRAIELEFRRSLRALPSQKEVLVRVEQAGGRATTDSYVGTPLKRERNLDGLGRIRRNRKPVLT